MVPRTKHSAALLITRTTFIVIDSVCSVITEHADHQPHGVVTPMEKSRGVGALKQGVSGTCECGTSGNTPQPHKEPMARRGPLIARSAAHGSICRLAMRFPRMAHVVIVSSPATHTQHIA